MPELFTAESLYVSWINVSIILLTASLVFYHMSKVKSININHTMAAIISCSLILVNIIFTINSIIPYFTRSEQLLKYPTEFKNEGTYRIIYFIAGIIFILIEIIICYYFIADSW